MEQKFPLFIITGAGGVGKTTVMKDLRRMMPDYDVFDVDNIREFIGDEDKIQNIGFVLHEM
jgi:adenylate kinase